MPAIAATIVPFGERGWLATLQGNDDPVATGLAANRIADALRAADGIDGAVAGIDSVAIRFESPRINPETARMLLQNEVDATTLHTPAPANETITIPVCYGGAFGPDLAALAAHARLPEQAVIGAHASKPYRALTLGFAPGFAYLGMLDEQLRAPRLPSPRAHVPAGSVGIAGGFTCIYPLPSPGGWRLIGRTPMRLFDPSLDDPLTIKPGAEVQFRPICEDEFLAAAST